jgi:hypothetical protein
MLKVLNLSVAPEATWQKTALKPPHSVGVLLLSILPLMVVTLGVEVYALSRFGAVFGEIGRQPVGLDRALKYGVFYGVASLTVIFIGAALLKNVGSSFNLTASYSNCFVLMAFAYGPIFMLRMLDGYPEINTWICWAVGVGLSMRILYHGVAWWLKPEQTKGFGLFIMSFIYILVLSGLVHFASIQVLKGRLLKGVFEKQQAVLLHSAAK